MQRSFSRFKSGDLKIELEELLDQDSCQMQETLQVTQTTVSIPLKVPGFIQKQ